MDVTALRALVAEHGDRWRLAGVWWRVVDKQGTDWQAVCLDLSVADRAGQLVLWASGDVDMFWSLDLEHLGTQHHAVEDVAMLRDCLTELEGALGLPVDPR